MTKLSVCMVTFDRAHLLWRSLHRYAHQSFTDFELIVVDDGSTDSTNELCAQWAKHIDLKYIRVDKRGAGWRDCAMNINLGIRAAKGDVIAATHPEVMIGNDTLRLHYEHARDNVYVASKIYYLTPWDQDAIDAVPWATRGALAVRNIPGFYQEGTVEVTGNPDYTHEATDRHTNWESWVFGSMMRSTWKLMGGLSEQEAWGSIDLSFLGQRRAIEIVTNTLMEETSLCVHQNHDDPSRNVPTPRDMEKAFAQTPTYPNRESAMLKHLW